MSNGRTRKSKEERSKYNKELYHANELVPIRAAIRYYQKKKEQGKDWTPKPWSRLSLYCKENKLDPEAVILDITLLEQASSE